MKIDKIINGFEKKAENLLSMLHEIQDSKEEHYLDKEDIITVSDYLGLPYSFVHGVATFYTMYSLKLRRRVL